MQLNYTARHFNMGDEMKEYLEKRMQKVKKYYDDEVLKVDVIADLQNKQFTFEVKVSAKRDHFVAKETSFEWKEAIDFVSDKIEKEASKLRDKVKKHH